MLIERQLRWKRALERDRLSRLAMEDEDDDFPGPGAASTAKQSDDEGGEDSAVQQTAQAEEEEALTKRQAKKRIKELTKTAKSFRSAVRKAIGIVRTRWILWANMPTPWFPLTLPVMHAHKLLRDGAIRAADPDQLSKTIEEIRSLSRRHGLPTDASLSTLSVGTLAGSAVAKLKNALTLEWLILLLIDLIVAVVILAIIALVAVIMKLYECATSPVTTLISGCFK